MRAKTINAEMIKVLMFAASQPYLWWGVLKSFISSECKLALF